MSRQRPRRKKRPDQPVAVVEMDIVCTGRRTHSRNRLAKFRVFTELREVRPMDDSGTDFYLWEPRLHGDAANGPPHMTRTYKCERCGRVVPLKDETADEILLRLAGAGESYLDISALHVM